MRRFSLFLLFFHVFCFVYSQNSLPNTYIFNGKAASIYAQKVYSDTIVCVGVSYRDNDTISAQQGALIAFFDSCGNLIRYKKFFDSQGRDIFANLSNKIVKTQDGSYFFVGNVGTNRMLFKTTMFGDSVFMKEYPSFLNFDVSNFVSIHSINSCLYIIGYGYKNTPYKDDHFVVKTDFDGNVLDYWQINTQENCEYFSDADTTSNNIIIGIAQTNLCLSGIIESKTRIIEVDTLGNIQWDWIETQGKPKYWGGFGVKRTPDGGLIYGGAYIDTFYSGVHFFQPFVTKIDSNFNHKWTHKIGYSDDKNLTIYDINIDSAGNYLAAGYYTIGRIDFPNPAPLQCAIVSKISSDGEMMWTNIVKAFQEDSLQTFIMYTQNVSQLSSGNIILGGSLFRIVNFELYSEGWLAKLSPSGEVLDDPDPQCGLVSVQQVKIEPPNNMRCYPNPANEILHLQVNDYRLNGCSWRLFDAYGQTVRKETIGIGNGIIEINVASLPAGIYFWEARSKGGWMRSSGKVVKQ